MAKDIVLPEKPALNLDDFISGKTTKPGAGRPKNRDADEWTRQTFIVREEYLELIRRVAYWDRLQAKEVLDDALRMYAESKGSYDPVPQR